MNVMPMNTFKCSYNRSVIHFIYVLMIVVTWSTEAKSSVLSDGENSSSGKKGTYPKRHFVEEIDLPIARVVSTNKTQMLLSDRSGPPRGYEISDIKVVAIKQPLESEDCRIPWAFYWPDLSSLTNEFYAASMVKDDSGPSSGQFSKWIANILYMGENLSESPQLYRENSYVTYWVPDSENVMARFVRIPYMKGHRFPEQVQICVSEYHSQISISELANNLIDLPDKRPLLECKIPILLEALEKIPLSNQIKTASWTMTNYEIHSDWNAVTIRFNAQINYVATELWITIGPNGFLTVLSGAGLQFIMEENVKDRFYFPDPESMQVFNIPERDK